jgi:hypothetical protein
MDVSDQLIGVRRDNCKRAYPLARGCWVFPVLPNAAETKWPTILHGDCVGLFGFLPLDCHPFEEPVHRNDAASVPVSVVERRQGVYVLTLGVDRLSLTLRVIAPIGNQAPAQWIERGLARPWLRRMTKRSWLGAAFQRGG